MRRRRVRTTVHRANTGRPDYKGYEQKGPRRSAREPRRRHFIREGLAVPDKNQLFYGNNLDVLRESIDSDSVDLVYLDPPFNSKRD